jgi:hypothetical protein
MIAGAAPAPGATSKSAASLKVRANGDEDETGCPSTWAIVVGVVEGTVRTAMFGAGAGARSAPPLVRFGRCANQACVMMVMVCAISLQGLLPTSIRRCSEGSFCGTDSRNMTTPLAASTCARIWRSAGPTCGVVTG